MTAKTKRIAHGIINLSCCAFPNVKLNVSFQAGSTSIVLIVGGAILSVIAFMEIMASIAPAPPANDLS